MKTNALTVTRKVTALGYEVKRADYEHEVFIKEKRTMLVSRECKVKTIRDLESHNCKVLLSYDCTLQIGVIYDGNEFKAVVEKLPEK